MLAIAAAIILFLSRVVGVVDDTEDFSWFWFSICLFFLHFGWDWGVGMYNSRVRSPQ